MSILMKGIKMPRDSHAWPFARCEDWGYRCIVGGGYVLNYKGRCGDCPLIEIPPNTAFIDKGGLYREIAEQRDLALEDCEGISTANPLVLKYIATANVWTKVAEIVADTPVLIETEGEKE